MRGSGVGRGRLNRATIPALCRKAGVPTAEVRGTITSHRARSTIATQLRTVDVPVDRHAVTSGAAAAGEHWQYYDLGHGLRTCTFFERCPHRMACAKCDFRAPRQSTKTDILAAKANPQHTSATIELADEERAAAKTRSTGCSPAWPPDASAIDRSRKPLPIAGVGHGVPSG